LTLSRQKDVRAPGQRSNADFWPMTIIMTVAIIGIFIVFARLAGII
jgi:hypothetical protein